jgi:hypothetical protein
MMDNSPLPAYSTASALASPQAPPPNRELTTHETHINASKGKPWLTLKLRSRARDANKLPEFLTGDRITGSIELDLPKGDPIVGITVTVML